MEAEFNHLNHATWECKYQCARSSWRDPAGESPAQARP
jgi:hypothetical protein